MQNYCIGRYICIYVRQGGSERAVVGFCPYTLLNQNSDGGRMMDSLCPPPMSPTISRIWKILSRPDIEGKKKDVERNRGSTRMNLSRGVEKDREMLVEFSFNSNEERKKRKVLRTRSILDNLDIGGAVT